MPRINSARDIIIALSNKYHGDWNSIYNAICKHEVLEAPEAWCAESKMTKQSILTDADYPEALKHVNKPPFVLYYRGDLSIASAKHKVATTMSRHPDTELRDYAFKLIQDLPEDYIIVTSDARVAKVADESSHKVILILPCGWNCEYNGVTDKLAWRIIANGGLVVTTFPDDVLPDTNTCAYTNLITAGFADALLVIELHHQGSGMISIMSMVETDKPVMVIPTNPNEDIANNSIIKEGACLVETVEDIIDILDN